MIAYLSSKIGKVVAAIVAAASILLGVFFVGRKSERTDNRVDDLEAYIETKKEIDDVKISPDPAAATERLHRNGWTR